MNINVLVNILIRKFDKILNNEDKIIIILTNKQFNNIQINDNTLLIDTITKFKIRNIGNYYNLFLYCCNLTNNRYEINYNTLELIKCKKIFRYLIDNKYCMDILCEYIALNGHLDILKLARENGCYWDRNTCSNAARNGHLEVLKWTRLRENGCEWNDKIKEIAKKKGYVEINE